MKRVLIADDSLLMRTLIKRLFVKHNYTVVGEAANGREAFEKYKELKPDMVTLDITMNEMNGIEALKEILNFDKDAVAVMVSAMGQRSYVEEAIKAGAKGFFVKPFDEQQVVTTVKKLLGC